jgi:putative methionine-R-sulfoxide reductase with GAF domain
LASAQENYQRCKQQIEQYRAAMAEARASRRELSDAIATCKCDYIGLYFMMLTDHLL